MIAWLTRKFSRDPGQLGLFEVVAPSVVRQPAVRSAPEPVVPARGAPSLERIDALHAPLARSAAAPRDPDAFLHALRAHGLRGVERVVFTRNRRTMVSLASGVLRVHEGFASAPAAVHGAIATFATSRNRAKRSAAREVIVSYPVPIRPAARRPAEQHADDLPMAARLTTLHAQLNLEHFDGALTHLEILVSRRLARRLGHYTPRAMTGGIGEIVLSRRHVRRDGWPEAIHTLLHEMVHQWQDETGRSVDHGAGFRAKCRAVGIEPAATRLISRA
ncbi:MAG: SprT-like domain-containing protein [Gemmatimonadaceae bacterium]|nr:SprT-like domain-containing protein [Gemmatimonadaceae bacterium]